MSTFNETGIIVIKLKKHLIHQTLQERNRKHMQSDLKYSKKNTRQTYRLNITRNWDGSTASPSDMSEIVFSLKADEIVINVEAPFYDDPPPSIPAGEKDGLWNFEVVELFLLCKSGRYMEIEIGPYGHSLILALRSVRRVSDRRTALHCTTRINGNRWQGVLTLSPEAELLPFTHANAYAIHGQEPNRRYLAASPVPGERPDFHQPARFIALKDLQ